LDLKDIDMNCNILDWKYSVYESGDFDVVWASPPCAEYSKAKTVGVRKIDNANNIILNTFEISDYRKPTYRMAENPQTGLLTQQLVMFMLHYNDIDYCMYGMPYKMRTRIWNKLSNWKPKTLCNSMLE
jgi:site-specific DNA-cytosine methylase